MKELLKKQAEAIGVILTDTQLEQCDLFYTTLVEWNKNINLTGIIEESDIITKHFVDSFTVLQALPKASRTKKISLIDIGSGAGFPGIALKIARPDISLTLVESVGKKASFLQEIISLLKLENCEVQNVRAEDLGHNQDYREMFDIATARAVANLSTLSEYTLPFLKIGGYVIAQKSSHQDEVKNAERAIEILGGSLKKTIPITLPSIQEERNLIIIEKVKGTPQEYPRKAGTPLKEPL